MSSLGVDGIVTSGGPPMSSLGVDGIAPRAGVAGCLSEFGIGPVGTKVSTAVLEAGAVSTAVLEAGADAFGGVRDRVGAGGGGSADSFDKHSLQ